MAGDAIVYDNPGCTACVNFMSDTAVCTAVNGASTNTPPGQEHGA